MVGDRPVNRASDANGKDRDRGITDDGDCKTPTPRTAASLINAGGTAVANMSGLDSLQGQVCDLTNKTVGCIVTQDEAVKLTDEGRPVIDTSSPVRVQRLKLRRPIN